MKHENWGDFLRDCVSIVDYIQGYESLTHIGGSEWQGAHATSHTSDGGKCLNVNADKGVWHCYSCGVKGDLISYEMERSKTEFKEACIHIAGLYKLTLPAEEELSESDRLKLEKQRKDAADVSQLLKAAAAFYHDQLDATARAYFHARGITDATIDTLKLGVAGESKTALYDHLSNQASRELILATGLVSENGNGRVFDTFNERYIFPYWRSPEQVCYFIGRDSTGGRLYLDKATGKRKTRSKYKKLRKTESTAVKHILWGASDVGFNEERTLLIVEGVVDAILAQQEIGDTYAVISPVTAQMNNSDIDRIAALLSKRRYKVVICNDTEASNAGQKGALATALKIQESVSKRIAEGLGDESNEDTIARRLPDIRLATLQKPPELEKIDVADYLQRGWKEQLIYWIESARELKRYQQYVEDAPTRFFDGKTFIPKELSDELRNEGRFFAGISHELHVYRNGVYVPDGAVTSKEIAKKLFRQRNSSRVTETLEDLVRERYCPIERVDRNNYLNVKNGLLDLNTFELKPHSPFIPSTVQVPVDFNKKADCPAFSDFLSEISPGCEGLILQMIGYCLQNHAEMHKAFILLGGGANGKSTLLMALERLLGMRNVSHIPLQTLEDNRFAAAGLFGKLANFYADLPDMPLRKCDVFNAAVAGDVIQVERKYREPFEFACTATQVFSCNKIPNAYTTSEGYYRRLLIVPFPNRFDGKHRKSQTALLESIASKAELEGVLITALSVYLSARDAGEFTVPEASHAALKTYKESNEPALRFLTEACVETHDPNTELVRVDVYEAYKSWIEDAEPNRKPISDRKFYNCVRETFPSVKEGRRATGKRERTFEGLGFVS